ncbi:MAG: tyrosine-type recombinase/integrase [Candidatus Binatia bacterium]
MSTCLFRSPLAERLSAFFEIRHALGRSVKSDYTLFRCIDRFLIKTLKPGQPITRRVVAKWVKDIAPLSVGTRINRMCLFRQFCLYLNHFDPRTYLVHQSFLPRRVRPAPFIYTREQVQDILAAARRIGPPDSLRPSVMATLLGLLYATGLRVGEARKLTLADVDLEEGVLHVRETKFKKSRDVPISVSTIKALSDFLCERQDAGFSTNPVAPAFVNPAGKAYGQTQVYELFMEIVRHLGIRGPKGERGPRMHDFRHTFAVHRLAAWYKEGADLSVKLPLLTTYLGHTTVFCTEVYLQATAELLEEAGKRFHRYSAIPFPGREERHGS